MSNNVNITAFLKMQNFNKDEIDNIMLFLKSFDVDDIYIKRNKIIAYCDYSICYLSININTYYKSIYVNFSNTINNSNITLLDDYLENIEKDDDTVIENIKNIIISFIDINENRID